MPSSPMHHLLCLRRRAHGSRAAFSTTGSADLIGNHPDAVVANASPTMPPTTRPWVQGRLLDHRLRRSDRQPPRCRRRQCITYYASDDAPMGPAHPFASRKVKLFP
ncbi:unnamed protein product [Musa acuminata var. zebrina]